MWYPETFEEQNSWGFYIFTLCTDKLVLAYNTANTLLGGGGGGSPYIFCETAFRDSIWPNGPPLKMWILRRKDHQKSKNEQNCISQFAIFADKNWSHFNNFCMKLSESIQNWIPTLLWAAIFGLGLQKFLQANFRIGPPNFFGALNQKLPGTIRSKFNWIDIENFMQKYWKLIELF